MSKRGPGRPPIFTGKLAAKIVKVIRQKGITKGQIALAKKGIHISRPTMTKLAKLAGITFVRGRKRQNP